MSSRFAKQGFSGKADWECIRKLKANCDVPVIASGDLFSAQDAVNCIINTQADSIMFARGALRDPLVFKEYKVLLNLRCNDQNSMSKPDELRVRRNKQLKIHVIRTHIELIREFGRDKNPIYRLRGILARYIRGFDRSKAFREMAVKLNSWDDIERLLKMLEEDIR